MKKINIYKNISCLPIKIENDLESFFLNKIESNKGFYSVAINAEKIIRATENPSFSEIVEASELPVPDGSASIILFKKKGFLVKKIDLPQFTVKFCSNRGLRLAIVGASKENNRLAIENLQKDFPKLKLVFGIDGYVSEKAIFDRINYHKPNVIILGLGSPKQEIFSVKLTRLFPSLIVINSGGAIDVFSGAVKRAPIWIQQTYFEWLYRIVMQPKRIKRYIKLIKFVNIYFKA